MIDLSELTFMDLVGLRTLLRAVEGETAGLARLVGATGIVRRLLELAQTIGSAAEATAHSPAPGEPTTTVTAVAAAWTAAARCLDEGGAGQGPADGGLAARLAVTPAASTSAGAPPASMSGRPRRGKPPASGSRPAPRSPTPLAHRELPSMRSIKES